MGSPVSLVVANLCMEEIKKTAINTTPVSPKFWKRYVDDSICIIKSDAVASFHYSLNCIDQHISFIIEHESNGQLPFLDTLISCKNGKLMVDIYRRPTHTGRYLDFHSHCDRKQKISTAETLLHRALNLPNTQVGKTRKTAWLCLCRFTLQWLSHKNRCWCYRKESKVSTTYTYTRRVGRYVL